MIKWMLLFTLLSPIARAADFVQHLNATHMQDLKTLFEVELGPEVTSELAPDGARLMDARGRVIWDLKITRDPDGLPASLIVQGLPPLDLKDAWEKVRAASTEEDVIRSLAPIQNTTAQFLARSFGNARLHLRGYFDQPKAVDLRARPWWTRHLSNFVGMSGAGLATWGAVNHNFYPGTDDWAVTKMIAGGLLATIPMLDQSFSGRESLLEKVIYKIRERRHARAQAVAFDRVTREREARQKLNEARTRRTFEFGHVAVSLSMTDLVDLTADAYVIPANPNRALFTDVGWELKRINAMGGLDAYNELVQRNGPFALGAAVVTTAGPGLNAGHMIHTVTNFDLGELTAANVASNQRREFQAVRQAYAAAIEEARGQGYLSIVAPILSVGARTTLEPRSRTLAVLLGIQDANRRGDRPLHVTLVSYDKGDQFSRVAETLESAVEQGIQEKPALTPTLTDEHLWACEKELQLSAKVLIQNKSDL